MEEEIFGNRHQKVVDIGSPRNRPNVRGGHMPNDHRHRVNLHHVENSVSRSRSPPAAGVSKQLARNYSARNLVRRVGEVDQALMAHNE